MKASRHANMKTHVRYHCLTNESIDKKYEVMNPLLCFNASRRKAMDDLAHVTPDKFQKRDIVILNQDHQEQIFSSPKDTS